MRTSIPAVAALAAFASAQSTTTSIDIDAISVAVPTSVFVLPVVYVTEEGAPTLTATTLATTATASSDPSATNVFDSAADVTAAISSASEIAAATATPLSKRDASCLQQPLGISYNSVPDTAAAFAADAYYGLKAVAAGTPTGYVQTFSNLTASNSADQYMGFTLLSSYDVATCVNKCTAIDGCNSVNIYFERDPTVNPDSVACANPSSTVNIKCVFWGGAVTSANANNFGQWRDNFQVLIAGSNGYMNSVYAAKLANKATATSSSSAAASATDAAGNIYTIYYSSDSTTGAYSNAQAASSYTDCMTACDADSQCNAFTYVGGTNGVGAGTCWLKTGLGSASPAGSNVVSGSRSGKASSSSSSKAVSTTSYSSSSSSSVVSTSSSSSSVVSTSSSSSSVASTSSVSKTSSSSSSSVAPSTTSSSSSVVPTTLSTMTKSASSTSASSSTSQTSTSTTTSSTSLSTAFYIVPWQGYYAKVASGSSATVGYSTSQSSATKFQLDTTTGALIEVNGNNVGYAASMPQGVNTNQKLVFNPTGTASNNYISCGIDNNNGWLYCSAGGVGQQAYACSADSYSQMYFGPSIPSGCSWIGLYRVSA